MKPRILFGAAMVVSLLAAGFVAPTVASATGMPPKPPMVRAGVCSGGSFPANPTPVPSGTYSSLTIKGACQAKTGAVITVRGNLYVAPGGLFDAQSYPSTITVRGNVLVGKGAFLGLGCDPNPPGHFTGHPCMDAQGNPITTSAHIRINGSLFAWKANLALLNGITVKGSVILNGSEGTATVAERANAIPWAIKMNTIGGDFIAANMSPIWIGLVADHVRGNVVMYNIHITDGLPPNNDPTPTIQVVLNTVGRNLVCFRNGPNLNVLSTPGGVHNVVGGRALGQCAA